MAPKGKSCAEEITASCIGRNSQAKGQRSYQDLAERLESMQVFVDPEKTIGFDLFLVTY